MSDDAKNYSVEVGCVPVFVAGMMGPAMEGQVKLLRSGSDAQVVRVKSVLDLGEFLKISEGGLVLCRIASRDDFIRILNFLKSHLPLIKGGSLKVMTATAFDHPAITSNLQKFGVSAVMVEPIVPRQLSFKIRKEMNLLTRQFGSLRSNSTSEKNRGVESKASVQFIEPLDFESDCWLIENRSASKVMGRWSLSITGPGLGAGEWISASFKEVRGSVWQWKPLQPIERDPFIKNEGAWYFVGDRPLFKQEHWVFSSRRPDLAFWNEEKRRASKFHLDESGNLLIAKDSEAAQGLIEQIRASFDSEVHLDEKDSEEKEAESLKLGASASRENSSDPDSDKEGESAQAKDPSSPQQKNSSKDKLTPNVQAQVKEEGPEYSERRSEERKRAELEQADEDSDTNNEKSASLSDSLDGQAHQGSLPSEESASETTPSPQNASSESPSKDLGAPDRNQQNATASEGKPPSKREKDKDVSSGESESTSTTASASASEEGAQKTREADAVKSPSLEKKHGKEGEALEKKASPSKSEASAQADASSSKKNSNQESQKKTSKAPEENSSPGSTPKHSASENAKKGEVGDTDHASGLERGGSAASASDPRKQRKDWEESEAKKKKSAENHSDDGDEKENAAAASSELAETPSQSANRSEQERNQEKEKNSRKDEAAPTQKEMSKDQDSENNPSAEALDEEKKESPSAAQKDSDESPSEAETTTSEQESSRKDAPHAEDENDAGEFRVPVTHFGELGGTWEQACEGGEQKDWYAYIPDEVYRGEVFNIQALSEYWIYYGPKKPELVVQHRQEDSEWLFKESEPERLVEFSLLPHPIKIFYLEWMHKIAQSDEMTEMRKSQAEESGIELEHGEEDISIEDRARRQMESEGKEIPEEALQKLTEAREGIREKLLKKTQSSAVEMDSADPMRGPNLGPLEMAFLISGFMMNPERRRARVLQRFCSYLSSACWGARVELWIEQRGNWFCGSTHDHSPPEHEEICMRYLEGINGASSCVENEHCLVRSVSSVQGEVKAVLIISGIEVSQLEDVFVQGVPRALGGFVEELSAVVQSEQDAA